MLSADYFRMSVAERRVARTGTPFPNRRKRRAARSRTERKLGFVCEELVPVLAPYRKEA